MLPFIATQLEMLLRDVMKRFIKTEVIASATTAQKLISIDVNDEKNHKHIHRVDVGCVATEELKVVEKNKSVSERQIFDFKASCKTFLLTLTGKLMAKSPLHKSIVRNLTCLNPVEICTHNQKCIDKFKAVVSVLISEKYIHVLDGDEVQRQFEYFVEEYKHSENFTSFSKEKDRLDQLYFSSMANDKKYDKLWPVISKLLLLSHGQATVERGFSTNKEVLEQNLSERNLMAKRVIKDFIKHVGGIQNIEVTKELLQSAQSARQMYFSYLEESKKCKELKAKSEKRKLMEDEVETIRKKYKQFGTDIEILNESADENMRLAEEKQNLSFVSKANALRNKAKLKMEVAKYLNQLLCEKEFF